MHTASTDRSERFERATLAAASLAYLVVFNRVVPHGDALRVVRQIDAGSLIWNPNHLTFDPLGYAWFGVLRRLGFATTALASFEIISAVSTIVSVWLFHRVLVAFGVHIRSVRCLAVVGLFASQAFLSMAVSQYYFMVQMPFLLGALLLIARLTAVERGTSDASTTGLLAGIGVLLAIAATLMFNNVLLVGAIGAVAGLRAGRGQKWHPADTARLWAAAAAVGIPVFVLGYVASGTPNSFFQWLFAYQGDADTKLNDLYGMDWTPSGLAISVARAAFSMLSAATLETAGLGTLLRGVIRREPLEVVPDYWRVALSLCLMPVIIATIAALLTWTVWRFREQRLLQFALAWFGAYFVFNVLWSSSGDLFWFQVLPMFWLLIGVRLGAPPAADAHGVGAARRVTASRALVPIVSALLAVNTMQVVVPVSLVDLDALGEEHMALLQDGDLEILPGWDGFGWIPLDPEGPAVRRITLMEMALENEASERHIRHLPELVAAQLARRERVVVGRLYDKDHESNPWYGLARLGWPRARIQELLGSYCTTEVGRVDGVVFRQLAECRR